MTFSAAQRNLNLSGVLQIISDVEFHVGKNITAVENIKCHFMLYFKIVF